MPQTDVLGRSLFRTSPDDEAGEFLGWIIMVWLPREVNEIWCMTEKAGGTQLEYECWNFEGGLLRGTIRLGPRGTDDDI